MSISIIVLDSNEYIFGLSKLQEQSVDLLKRLSSFNVKLPRLILDELHANLSEILLKNLYLLIRKSGIEVIDRPVPLSLVQKYRKDLPAEDAVIAAYCDFLKVDVLISENRHFLVNFQPKSFIVLSARQFNNIGKKE